MAPYTSALAEAIAPDLLARFDRYVRIDTQAARDRTRCPSTPGQLELAEVLARELGEIGLPDAAVDENGYVTATLAASGGGDPETVIGLVAHVDTSPDAPGAGVVPIVHRDYDGGVIELPRSGTRLDPATEPHLASRAGHDIVTASGDTLLGADDKAGVAEIMAAVAYLHVHPELPRPTIRICFTPDEEIGEGATLFDVDAFGARCAYTLDGSSLGELQDETFSALETTITVTGVDVHPGFATGILVNAARVAARIVAALPQDRLTPETTCGREGFIHVYELTGDAGSARIRAIVRDFDDELLAGHAELLRSTAQAVVDATPGASVTIETVEQYPNMRAHLEPFPEVLEHAIAALRAEGLEPLREPIRGGTDGSRLSAMGLPTPNIFTGGHAYHSVREWASLQDMAAAAAVVVHLAAAWAAVDGTAAGVARHAPGDLSDEAEWEGVVEAGAEEDLEGVAPAMRVTHAGLREVEESEGFSSTPYLDRLARPPVWTQGFGDTKGVGPNSRPVTRAEAERRLVERFESDFAWALEPFVGLDGFNQNMYDALASFVWNLGPGAVGTDTTIGRRLRARDWHGAADAMLDWNKAGGVVVQGLVNRRRRERELFLTPAGHPDDYYLTTWERDTVAALELERRIAERHGGWDKVDASHLQNASRAKADLRERLRLLAAQDVSKLHRRRRIAALKQAIAGTD